MVSHFLHKAASNIFLEDASRMQAEFLCETTDAPPLNQKWCIGKPQSARTSNPLNPHHNVIFVDRTATRCPNHTQPQPREVPGTRS
jgi:hypothetical protein